MCDFSIDEINEIDSVDMISFYETYFHEIKPFERVIGQDVEKYYPVGMVLGFDDQVWLVFRNEIGGTLYRKQK